MIPILLVVVSLLEPAAFTGAGADEVACTFSNPRYAGKCVEHVAPASDQTPVQACTMILDCLNNAHCVKTYCKATTVRGGWSLDSPGPDELVR